MPLSFLVIGIVCVWVGEGMLTKMHQGENYQDSLKWWGVFLGHSLIIK